MYKRQLLDIAAIESGTLKTNIEVFPVNDVFADIDGQNSLAAEQNQVDLRLVPSDMMVKTDRVLLTTMVQNLVSNRKESMNEPESSMSRQQI